MRLLQTSDWHLGKIFHERMLIEDQKCILDQILNQVAEAKKEKKPYNALLIPGDIYDRAVPSQEAAELLNYFIDRINTEHPDLHVFIISGNHDSATRLSYGAKIFAKQNIHICTDTKELEKPVIIGEGNDKAAIYQIPFLTPLSIKAQEEGKHLRQQQELYEVACATISKAHKENCPELPSIICAHLFSIGIAPSSSERSYVGPAEQVDISLFKNFTYGAFGHIHGFHYCDKEKRITYSGSPLAYNFDDSPDTYMLDVNIENAQSVPVVNKIKFKPLHPIIKLEGKLKEFLEDRSEEVKKYKDYFIEVTLTDEVMPIGSFNLLQSVMPNLLHLVIKGKHASENTGSLEERKAAIESRDPSKIIEQYLSDIYSKDELEKEVVEKEKEIFISIVKKTESGEV